MPKCSTIWRWCAAVLTVLAAFPAAAAGDGRIADIEVRGHRRLAPEAIEQMLPLKRGDTYDAAAANSALKALFASGQFADVRIDFAPQTGKAVVTIAEHPAIHRVLFEGNSALDGTALKKAAALEPGRTAAHAAVEIARERIAAAYTAKGYTTAVIASRITPTSDGRADITFAIEEGRTGKIESVGFTGNTAISQATLADVVTTRRAGLLDFLQQPRSPDSNRLQHDRERLADFYRTKGYADAHVASAVIDRDAASGDWRITFPIEEGALYRTADVRIDPASSGISADALQRHVAMQPGSRWDQSALDKSIERITAALIDADHTDIAVTPIIDRDPKSATIAVALKLVRVPAIRIERVEISGNARTRDQVIRRELLLSEGGVFHPLLAERSRRRLIALGLFRTVEIDAGPGRDKAHTIVAVRVVEQDTRVLEWGGGYSSTEGITGDVTLTERNLLGHGQTLRLTLAASETRLEGAIGFVEPRMFGYRLAGSLDLFYRTTDNSAVASYRSTKLGGRTGLGFELAENWKAGVTYSLTRTTLSDVGLGASAAIRQAAGFPDATTAAYITSALGTSLTYDTRDRPSQPMRGVYMTSTQELAGLGGDVRHLRSTVEGRGYIPVGERSVIATRATAGTISGWGGSEVRLLEMFYKGGETVRGFAPGGIGPRDSLGANRDALGGTSYIATTAEFRTPLPLTPSDFGLRIAVFADAGSLWGSSKSVKSTAGVVGTTAALRASVGVGLIWDSPLGPLRVDYSRPLVKQAFDKTRPLSFGLVPF